VFLAMLMAALGVYWAVSIQSLVSDTPGVEGAGWGIWLTALGSVSTLLATIALLVVAIRSPRRERPMVAAPAAATAPVVSPAGWYPDPGAQGVQRYWDGTQWTQHTSPAT
jgi:Protein of unknown function (DUF2510)